MEGTIQSTVVTSAHYTDYNEETALVAGHLVTGPS